MSLAFLPRSAKWGGAAPPEPALAASAFVSDIVFDNKINFLSPIDENTQKGLLFFRGKKKIRNRCVWTRRGVESGRGKTPGADVRRIIQPNPESPLRTLIGCLSFKAMIAGPM